MKTTIVIILGIISQICFGQNCGCNKQRQLNEIISCKKTIFKNGAKIYRQFNCDSSWVVFESKAAKKKILFSLDKELIELTERLGYSSWTEYKKAFIIENRLASGCCDPSEFILFDKNDGRKIAEIGREIYHSEIEEYPYFISIDKEKGTFLSFLNLETNRIFRINLPKGRIEETLKYANSIFPESLFEKGEIKNGIFEIKYKYKKREKDNWSIGKVIVDLNKYK
jgi:hypothetical protein